MPASVMGGRDEGRSRRLLHWLGLVVAAYLLSFVVLLIDATWFGEKLLNLSDEAKDVVEVIYFPLLVLLYYLGFF